MPLDRACLYGAILAVLAAGSTAGCGGIVSTPLVRQPIKPGSIPPPDVKFEPGEWTATGTILETTAADGRPGEEIVRPWGFRKICENHSCHTIFVRQTLYGPRAALLEAHGGHYVAVFPPAPTPCPHYPGEDAGTSENYATFTLWWSANRQEVLAMEHERYEGRDCGEGETESVRWVARRTNSSAAAPAPGP